VRHPDFNRDINPMQQELPLLLYRRQMVVLRIQELRAVTLHAVENLGNFPNFGPADFPNLISRKEPRNIGGPIRTFSDLPDCFIILDVGPLPESLRLLADLRTLPLFR
jgi:hypothetical protein